MTEDERPVSARYGRRMEAIETGMQWDTPSPLHLEEILRIAYNVPLECSTLLNAVLRTGERRALGKNELFGGFQAVQAIGV